MDVSLVDAVLHRRSRRVGLGMRVPEGGPLAFSSAHEPLPLSDPEEAFLVWLGTGTTGLALGDLPTDGLAWMHAWAGRAWPCSCNSHSTELFYTNDDGLFLVDLRERPPENGATALFSHDDDESTIERIGRLHRESRVRLEAGRADLPDGEPGLFAFNSWNVNRPGTTLFMPVTNTTIEYLTLLFIYFDEEHRFSIVDELDGGSACGLHPWRPTGRICDDVTLSLMDLEMRVLTTLNVEQAFIAQNMSLALQALGLGGWAFTGFLPHHLMGGSPRHRGLGFRFSEAARGPRHVATSVPIGRDGAMEGLCPPYVPDMRAAVERFLHLRAAEPADGKPYPYADPERVLMGRGRPSEETIDIVAAFCTHVHSTYGRFPAFIDPMFARLVIQAHHLDLDFYDAHYREGAYGPTHREHMALWHADA
jgi:hypothetical protein